MKNYLSLVVMLVAAAGFLFACQQLNFSHRIFFKNDSGAVIAIAQIALPQAMFFEADSFTGKWMLESSKEEFPKEGTSAKNYRAKRSPNNVLLVNLNPDWADNNVVLYVFPADKQANSPLQGDWWCYQTRAGCETLGTLEIVPTSSPEALLVEHPKN